MKASIIPGDDEERCFICGRWGPLQVHHCLHGSDRKMADRYGLTVHLCITCHSLLHDRGEHDRELQRVAQRAFENKYSHDEFMRVFGRNFL